MTVYQGYLELSGASLCMAHVPSLPGCCVRASSRREALEMIPDAVRQHLDWLRGRGETVPGAGEPIEVSVGGEFNGCGPFDPGDAAALLPPDRQPLSPEDMEGFFRVMTHSRADLIGLFCAGPHSAGAGVSDELLDWRTEPGSLSLRQLLRHVGNAEEWYVSRLVPAETLPAEWEQDDELPIFEFLAMERRTAVQRLRELTECQRAEVFYPRRWTSHPEEAWTARKALRRFLEHEREHTGQAREILAAYITCSAQNREAAEDCSQPPNEACAS